MHKVSVLSFVWRLVLAVSLVMAPLVPMAAPDHEGAAASVEAAAMPCHEAAVPPPAADASCDDGCCPMPDCDPGACRIAGSLIATGALMLPSQPPAVPVATFSSPVLPGAPFGEPLRPPIA